MKNSRSDKVKFTATRAVTEGEGNPDLMVAIIKKLLEALGSEAVTCRRDSPALYQTTCNTDNMLLHTA
jgi:hypothetical protein